METILDYEKDIRYPTDAPPLMHAHAIDAHRHGLKHLADQMRDQEQAYIDANEWPSYGRETIPDFAYWEPVTYCIFNWFAISLTSYLRLIAVVDLTQQRRWGLHDLVSNSDEVEEFCRGYVEGVVPAVHKWRNKVAAHPAATAPLSATKKQPAESLGTILQSFSCPVSRTAGYFEVGSGVWRIDGQVADLLPWSVTATYEKLTPRFWPDASLRPHRHRPGSEPLDEPNSYYREIRLRG